jgi:hypothetical protein
MGSDAKRPGICLPGGRVDQESEAHPLSSPSSEKATHLHLSSKSKEKRPQRGGRAVISLQAGRATQCQGRPCLGPSWGSQVSYALQSPCETFPPGPQHPSTPAQLSFTSMGQASTDMSTCTQS